MNTRGEPDNTCHGIELIWFPGTCSRVTLVALEEIGCPFTLTLAPSRWNASAEYLAINPKGKVPVLVIDRARFTETPAIITYLAQIFPEARLLPTGNTLVEIDALTMMSWFASGVHPLVSRLRFPAQANDDPDTFERTAAMAGARLLEIFAMLEHRLIDRNWLYDDWSVVDAYMLWLWFRAVGSGMNGAAFPLCADHARRCEQRPSVARALEHEENEYAGFLESGRPLPPHQVGRAPSPPVA